MLALLMAVPILFGAILYYAKTQRSIALTARIGSVAVMALSTLFCAMNFNTRLVVDLSTHHWVTYAVLIIEAGMAAYMLSVSRKNKSSLLGFMALAHIIVIACFELFHSEITVHDTIIVDKLSLLMILIIGVIGGLISIYAIEYMKDYHRHHPEVQDRRGLFFMVLFVFMSAMFGLVISNKLSILLFFWELTTLASFLLIGYTQSKIAVNNAMLAIKVNVFGGLLFAVGIVVLGVYENVASIDALLAAKDSHVAELAIFLIACAAMTKSAQLPFSKWLLGAMVAPTPTSAMLHSSTMVKAGVYLLVRMSPLLGHTPTGITVTVVGGVTFFFTALMAISQTDAKRVLAYSTISNLGLIVACTGINTAEALWAAIMLIIFHAIAKSLLFLSVGSTEHQLGSRSIEDMDGLIGISSQLTFFLVIGIAGMFVAPFGMLISKWAAMKALLDSNNAFAVMLVAFGSTATLFFWTKWMGKLIANAHRASPTSYIMRIDEKVALYALTILVIIVCILHPVISFNIVIPYIDENHYINFASPIDFTASAIIIFMLGILFVLPLLLMPLYRKYADERTTIYLSGEKVNISDRFYLSKGKERQLDIRNWYMERIFGEKVLLNPSLVIGAGALLVGFFAVLGGLAA